MSAVDSAIAREELRALLVLGIIGTLLGVRDVLNVNLGYGVTLGMITSGLMVFWGAYVFLMAIGVSGDLISESVAEKCEVMAVVCFLVGICVTVGVVGFIVVTWVLVSIFGIHLEAVLIGLFAGGAFTLIALIKILKGRNESAKRSQQ